jgi:hypothetical protein
MVELLRMAPVAYNVVIDQSSICRMFIFSLTMVLRGGVVAQVAIRRDNNAPTSSVDNLLARMRTCATEILGEKKENEMCCSRLSLRV